MTDQSTTAYIILLREVPTAVATDLATAQATALADRRATGAADQYEDQWAEHSPDEWRLMTRRRDRGGRWTWTQRAVRAVPLIHGEGSGASEQGPKGLKNAEPAPLDDEAQQATPAAPEATGLCPDCRHFSCRDHTPCNALIGNAELLDTQRCSCTGPAAAAARQILVPAVTEEPSR